MAHSKTTANRRHRQYVRNDSGRKESRRGRKSGRWLAFALLLVLIGGAGVWWKSRSWMPARSDFPVQGTWLSAADGAIDWPMLRNAGADFVYLTASNGAAQRDPAFGESLEQARQHKIQTGAVHVFDICMRAEGQAANFVTTVPRDARLLPPAVRLALVPERCPRPPGDAALQSELTTFLNQIERHAGKAALLMVSPEFEKRYHMAAIIDRNVWVEGSFLMPGYSGRPWVLWTANRELSLPAVERPVPWVVVRP